VKERVLLVNLETAVQIFDRFKWKFYTVMEDYVKVEVPRGTSESYVVEVPYGNEAQFKQVVDRLRGEEFIQQEIRQVKDW
jgi:hypothetical protein